MKTKTFKNGIIEATAVAIVLDECLIVDGRKFENSAYTYCLCDEEDEVCEIVIYGRNRMTVNVRKDIVKPYVGAYYEAVAEEYIFKNITQFGIKNRKTVTFYDHGQPVFDLDLSDVMTDCGCVFYPWAYDIYDHYKAKGEVKPIGVIVDEVERFALSYIDQPIIFE